MGNLDDIMIKEQEMNVVNIKHINNMKNLSHVLEAQIHLLKIFGNDPCDLKHYDNMMGWFNYHRKIQISIGNIIMAIKGVIPKQIQTSGYFCPLAQKQLMPDITL